jgi:hypothetical protein
MLQLFRKSRHSSACFPKADAYKTPPGCDFRPATDTQVQLLNRRPPVILSNKNALNSISGSRPHYKTTGMIHVNAVHTL